MFIQITGSALILFAFVLSQLGLLKATSVTYLILNVIGSSFLAFDAFHLQQWGFVALEGVWAIVSLIGLIRLYFENMKTKSS
ncbi:CBU_0592 family membrane protein [Lactococcus fujiensis]|uniref:Permease n=1 Tax=Lactococcus fujiensis JCM 16395 TaxID=1291764 RepID=A0A2A5RM59_9LACT|nr:hypothetical protein [Lactococcus fujiensis]PCS00373.1 permease [Lactococcus fujiensis JCM 16395]